MLHLVKICGALWLSNRERKNLTPTEQEVERSAPRSRCRGEDKTLTYQNINKTVRPTVTYATDICFKSPDLDKTDRRMN